jgi:hypothetical protein
MVAGGRRQQGRRQARRAGRGVCVSTIGLQGWKPGRWCRWDPHRPSLPPRLPAPAQSQLTALWHICGSQSSSVATLALLDSSVGLQQVRPQRHTTANRPHQGQRTHGTAAAMVGESHFPPTATPPTGASRSLRTPARAPGSCKVGRGRKRQRVDPPHRTRPVTYDVAPPPPPPPHTPRAHSNVPSVRYRPARAGTYTESMPTTTRAGTSPNQHCCPNLARFLEYTNCSAWVAPHAGTHACAHGKRISKGKQRNASCA